MELRFKNVLCFHRKMLLCLVAHRKPQRIDHELGSLRLAQPVNSAPYCPATNHSYGLE
jgi:hypothetical protein